MLRPCLVCLGMLFTIEAATGGGFVDVESAGKEEGRSCPVAHVTGGL